MTSFTFTKAVKRQEKARIALDGVTGGGKTWTALVLGTFFAEKEGGRIAVIDSERSSAKKYASDFDFDHLTLPDANPHTYIAAIKAAIDGGYAVIIIDSLTHAWEGTLELKDDVAKRSRGNSFDAWREVTPVHNELIDTMLRAPAHVIATMRTKTEYLVEQERGTDGSSKTKISKVGLRPMQREGVEYEFDIVGDMDAENTLVVSKTRCSSLNGAVVRRPGAELALVIWEWLNDGEAHISDEEAVTLVGIFDQIEDQLQRAASKQAFVAEFGKPTELFPSDLATATAWVTAHVASVAADIAPSELWQQLGYESPEALGAATAAIKEAWTHVPDDDAIREILKAWLAENNYEAKFPVKSEDYLDYLNLVQQTYMDTAGAVA